MQTLQKLEVNRESLFEMILIGNLMKPRYLYRVELCPMEISWEEVDRLSELIDDDLDLDYCENPSNSNPTGLCLDAFTS